ncbi:DUF4271 domain-containing protein [Hymenobacter sp. ASUV-10]|uniref:DUF4271 domain-containing protein n=1 Tax=Hymenobacter aranciens TaxID=3063996 RepID=A0ABT9B4Z6_9BACT|nr:DUF4271 domain-containing protein [Hymenobacter sp. ASUV-10]MDO7873344.1 DUF4271 domain-containing protein [Hymenobacter sp. ASUV-10]
MSLPGQLRTLLLLAGSLWLLLRPAALYAAEYQQLPPVPPTGLTAEWLIHDAARNRLILYLPGYHQPAHAYYQWVRLRPQQPFVISFTARPGLSLFLDNQLIFTATSASAHSLDLSRLLPAQMKAGSHLLGVWQPEGSPALSSFSSVTAPPAAAGGSVIKSTWAQPRLPGPQGESIFLGFLLVLGLLYGGVRSTYQSGMARIFQVEELFSTGSDQQSFLVKPAFTLLNLLLVLLFALSAALLLTAIHTDLQNLPLLRRFINVPESAIAARVLLYTGIIAAFVLGKYLFLELLAYIFDVQELVNVQYREFLRTTLLAGLLLPVILLLYIVFNDRLPGVINGAASAVIAGLLVITVLRVGRTLHHYASLFNLHLFAYLCATEVLPLLVLLRLIVFTY